jgi:hypothetical protein
VLCGAHWKEARSVPHCVVCLRARAFISLSLLRVPPPPDPACGVATMANMHFSAIPRRKLCHAVWCTPGEGLTVPILQGFLTHASAFLFLLGVWP